MANEQNLKPARSKSEARARGRKGGIKSGEKRRARKRMEEDVKFLLSMPSEVREGFNRQMSMLIAHAEKAEAGDLGSSIFLRDTAGEKPTDKKEVSGNISLSWEDWLDKSKDANSE